MTSDKKEKLLKKYLEKKTKQLKRDELFKQINAISGTNNGNTAANLLKTKIKNSKGRVNKKRQINERDEEYTSEVQVKSGDNYSTGIKDLENISPINDITEGIVEDENVRINTVENAFETILKGSGEVRVICNEDSVEERCKNLERLEVSENEVDYSKEEFIIEKCERTNEIRESREKLAIFYEEHEIVRQIKAHRIVFIHGDTGCGKTTQIPQFLLENGFRGKGLIGVTQPRRFAAISAAARINVELNEKLCGYKIKYENNITSNTCIKVMTEGILLREIQLDFFLLKYSIILLDEVHERTVNMDVLLGLLSKIVHLRFSRGKPLRLVLMSATANADDFRAVLGPIHQIELQGHSHKVSVFYESKTEENYIELIEKKIIGIIENEKPSKKGLKRTHARTDVLAEITNCKDAGILVFLPTKQDIYTLKERLDCTVKGCVILPLHSSLSREQQLLVYKEYGVRKVILATNVAETSITIDGIVFVIDSGRVKERVHSGGYVKYQVGFVSKSSAKQRMGRAGRTKPGVCLRMYDGNTYEAFKEKNRPQICMEPLDATLLQLKVLGVENIFTFPFPSPIEVPVVTDALDALQKLGALDSKGEVTSLGRRMSSYSIPPRYARILCVPDTNDIFWHLTTVAAILSIGFEVVKSEKTTLYFDNERSDIIVYLKIYYGCIMKTNMKEFARRHGLSIHGIQEINKLSKYLIGISGKDKPVDEIELTEKDKKRICKVLYLTFNDQFAVSVGNSYVSGDSTVFRSNDSVIALNENVVFDYIVCSKTKDYMKNITVVEKSWFKPAGPS